MNLNMFFHDTFSFLCSTEACYLLVTLTAKRFQSPLGIPHCVMCVVFVRDLFLVITFFSFVLSKMLSFKLIENKSELCM